MRRKKTTDIDNENSIQTGDYKAPTPEARERQMIALATDAAERQLREGTASAQVITYYLKLGSRQAKLEEEKLRAENRLLKAKTEAIQSTKTIEKLYSEAIDAMRSYSGRTGDEDYDD